MVPVTVPTMPTATPENKAHQKDERERIGKKVGGVGKKIEHDAAEENAPVAGGVHDAAGEKPPDQTADHDDARRKTRHGRGSMKDFREKPRAHHKDGVVAGKPQHVDE